jgi:uncharacterized protein (DUF4415 family)
MPPLKTGTIWPTPEEEAAINAGIAADPDTFELSDVQMALLRPIKTRGRPKLANAKQPVKLRLDPEVIEGFRAQGPGWQGRMNEALRAALGLRR